MTTDIKKCVHSCLIRHNVFLLEHQFIMSVKSVARIAHSVRVMPQVHHVCRALVCVKYSCIYQ